MVLGLHGIRTMIFGKRFYIYIYIYIYNFYIKFMFTFHCLMYLLFNFVYVTSYYFTSVSYLFRKYIWSHTNIWDGASSCNSLQSLAIDCINRELHLRCLHWFCMHFLLLCFKRSHWFVNAVAEVLIQQWQIVAVWFVYLLFYW